MIRRYGGAYSRYWLCSLPGAFISCVDKKRTKEATGGGAGASFLSSLRWCRSLSPRNKCRPPPAPSRHGSALIAFFFLSFIVSLCDRIFYSCPLGHTFTHHECGGFHTAGISHLAEIFHSEGISFRSIGAINCDLVLCFFYKTQGPRRLFAVRRPCVIDILFRIRIGNRLGRRRSRL